MIYILSNIHRIIEDVIKKAFSLILNEGVLIMTHKKLTGRNLKTRETCQKRAFFEESNMAYTKGLHYEIAIALKELWKETTLIGVPFNELKVLDFLKKKLPLSIFYSERQKEVEIQVLVEQIKRFATYLNEQGYKLVQKNLSGDVNIQGVTVGVHADFVFEKNDIYYVAKVIKGAPKLSYRAQKDESKATCNNELYLLQALGESLFDKTVHATFFHLKSKDDKNDVLSDEFEVKKGKNMITHHFQVGSDNSIARQASIVNLANLEITYNSPKNCTPTNCDMCTFQSICLENSALPVQKQEVKKERKEINLKLTNEQFEAISMRNGIVRINAGAGSGKTTVIALRLAEMLDEGVKPEEILLITYTNKGAEEMREKVGYWIKEMELEVDVKKINIFTFHSWSEMIIQKEYSRFGYTTPPTLIEKTEKLDTITNMLDKFDRFDWLNYKNPLMNFPHSKGAVIKMSEYIDSCKEKLDLTSITIMEEIQTLFTLNVKQAEEVFHFVTNYQKEIVSNNLMDFQDLINCLYKLAQNEPQVLQALGFKHIIVDEYQDTGTMEFDIMYALTENPNFQSLMVVGDDSQSIFGFRNTSEENIINFHLYFNEIRDIFLEDNFRSTENIITIANEINNLNVRKINKTLKSNFNNSKESYILESSTLENEYNGILLGVSKLIKGGTPLQEISIIARKKSELIKIQHQLNLLSIPSTLVVPTPLIEKPVIQSLMHLTDFFENESIIYPVFECLYHFKKATFEKSNITKEEAFSYTEKGVQRIINELSSLTTEIEKVAYYLEFCERLSHLDENVSSFVKHLKNKKFNTMDDLIHYVRAMEKYEDNLSADLKENQYNGVILTTIHSSKGKEFDYVFHTLNGYSALGGEELEEERRLLFVALTRARQQAFISYTTIPNTSKRKLPEIIREAQKTSLAKRVI